MISYYAARAAEYDDVYRTPERQSELREIEAWLSSIFAGDNVFEVACGTGYWTHYIAQTAKRMVALDATKETISIAKQRVSDINVSFIVGDAYALLETEVKFDSGFAGFWFSHVPRQRWREFMEHLFSKLKQEAKVVLLDSYKTDDKNSPTVKVDEHGNTYQKRTLADGTEHSVLKNFPSQLELEKLAADIGKQVTFNVWESYWAFTYESVSP